MFSKKFLLLGGGPAGLYLSKIILKNTKNVHIDLIEKNLYCGGLLRYGVAPDHPEIKVAIKRFDNLFSNENFNYFGNSVLPQNFLSHIIHSNFYSKIIFSWGAENSKKYDLKGEKLFPEKIIDANHIVNFYTNFYKKKHLIFPYIKSLQNAKKIIVVGNGNVSLDIVRLLTKKIDELKKYEINKDFLEMRNKLNIEEIVIIGRRGIIQAACDVKELREVIEESGFDIIIDEKDFEQSCDEKSLEIIDLKKNPSNRLFKRKFDLFKKIKDNSALIKNSNKKIVFKFLTKPLEIIERNGKSFLICARTELKFTEKYSEAKDKNEKEEIEFDFLIKSIGYEKTENFEKTPNVESCGWASSNGKGKLNDSYFDCENLIFDLMNLKDEKLIDFNLGEEIKSLGIDFMDKSQYLKLRNFENENNREVQEKEELLKFLK